MRCRRQLSTTRPEMQVPSDPTSGPAYGSMLEQGVVDARDALPTGSSQPLDRKTRFRSCIFMHLFRMFGEHFIGQRVVPRNAALRFVAKLIDCSRIETSGNELTLVCRSAMRSSGQPDQRINRQLRESVCDHEVG